MHEPCFVGLLMISLVVVIPGFDSENDKELHMEVDCDYFFVWLTGLASSHAPVCGAEANRTEV